MKKPTYAELATNYQKWCEYFDSAGQIKEIEFDETETKTKIQMLMECYGKEEEEETNE